MSGGKHLIRIVKDFTGESDDELTVTKGEIVQFIAKTEQYWYKVWQDAREAKLPIASCIEINARDLVALKIERDTQAIFIARYDFLESNKEDLSFAAKEMIIGLKEVNQDWWLGTRFSSVYVSEDRVLVDCKHCGIFPLSYVWKAREELLPEYVFSRTGTQVVYPRMEHSLANDAEPDPDPPETEVNIEDGKYLYYVKVVNTMTKHFDEEMDLPKVGEILGVVDDSDKLFYRGESLDGTRKGIFSKKFVQIVNNEEEEDSDGGTSPLPPSVPPPRLVNPSNMTYGEKHISFSNPSISHQDSLDSEPPSYEKVMSQGYNNQQYNVTAYGQVLYDYQAQQQDELSLHQNQIVHLLRHVDAGWMEGEINGQIGLVPKNYISIIVDCAETLSEPIEQFFAANTQAKALYDFDGERDKDLAIRAGQMLTLVRKFPNSDWIEAMSDNGVCGFVHNTFIEIIHPSAQSQALYANIDEFTDNKQTIQATGELKIQPTSSSEVKSALRASLSPKRSAPTAPSRRPPPQTLHQFELNEKLEMINGPVARQSEPIVETEVEVKTKETVLKNQRQCVITELIQTEKDYCHAMHLCVKEFERADYEADKVGFSVDKIFGDLKSVVSVSRSLLKLLDNYAHNRAYADQRVGVCFLELRTSIEESYTRYCRNHDTIIAQLKLYQANRSIREFVQHRLLDIQSQTNCFDIYSIIIKPVQRILKYPLLLNELIKCTQADHVDAKQLELALQMITNIATNINEHKRRQDLIAKYCKAADPSLGEKLKNINMHTVRKKGNRLKHRFLSTITFSHGETKDEVFDSLSHKFHATEKMITVFVNNLKAFIKNTNDSLGQSLVVIEAMNKYYHIEHDQHKDVEVLRSTQRDIYEKHFRQFEITCENEVLAVIRKLVNCFTIPTKLMQKRKDKLIDYESSLKSNKANSEEAQRNFDALNHQLIDELPLLIDNSIQIFMLCFKTFLVAYRKMNSFNTKIYLDRITKLPLVQNVSFAYYEDVEEGFRVKHNLVLDQMLKESSLLHASAFPNASLTKATNSTSSTFSRLAINRKSKDSWRNSMPVNKIPAPTNDLDVTKKQTQDHRRELESRYESTSLFQVTSQYTPSDLLDIAVDTNDLVGVIKKQDPMGLDHRWFVDKGGGVKGFLPQNILAANTLVWRDSQSQQSTPRNNESFVFPQAMHQPNEPPARYDQVPSQDDGPYDSVTFEPSSSLLSFEEGDGQLTRSSNRSSGRSNYDVITSLFDPLASPPPVENVEYRHAAYAFKAADDVQLSLDLGQRVKVLAKCDRKGNAEWWLVANDQGEQGYVPANYLKV